MLNVYSCFLTPYPSLSYALFPRLHAQEKNHSLYFLAEPFIVLLPLKKESMVRVAKFSHAIHRKKGRGETDVVI
jgi:hypothetical protein